MAHRGQWSEHEARGVLNAQRKSGLSLERFARERGLTPQRLRFWKAKFDGKSTVLVRSEAPLALLPVQVTEAAPSKRGEPVAVYLRSGHIVKVGRGFDEEAFARVVAVLEVFEMLGLPPSVRICFATGLVDMRNGINGLRTIVEQVLKRNPNDGHLFVFVGKRRDMLKILFWDKNGYVVYEGLVPSSLIAIASLGATRTLVFRSKDRERVVEVPLRHGSILLMNETTQREWQHAVKREPDAGLRVSLTFRQIVEKAGP